MTAQATLQARPAAADEIEVRSPFDGRVVGRAQLASPEATETMLARAHALFADRSAWPKLPERIAVLQRAAAILRERADDYARTTSLEGGKPVGDTRAEVEIGAQALESAVEFLRGDVGRRVPMGATAASANRLALTVREPLGVVAAVSAFNHAFANVAQQAIPAIAAGCPVIVKPATSTPLSALNFAQAMRDAGLPEGWLQIAVSRGADAERLVSDERVSFLSFVGSGAVGWRLRSILAPGTGCVLEHGGAAPIVVDEGVDIDEVAPLLTRGAFYHAGQVCVSVQRVFAHESVFDELAKRLAAGAKAVRYGDPTDAATQMGPLITAQEANRVAGWVDEAVAGGARLAAGGERLSEAAYAPTVLVNPPAGAKVSRDEVFGPVVGVSRVASIDEAIARANDVPYAFQAGIFSRDVDRCLYAAQRLQAVTVMVNDQTAFRTPWSPFGGRRHSGVGIGGVPQAMHELMPEKQVILRSKAL